MNAAHFVLSTETLFKVDNTCCSDTAISFKSGLNGRNRLLQEFGV